MRRQALTILLVAALLLALGGTRASAQIPRPAYRVGDFWAYATNLTEDLGLALDGTSRVEVVRFGSLAVQGSETSIAELLLTGGGTFTGAFEGVGTATGTWSITGTEAWETGAWKSVRSFFRLTAEGKLTGGPTPFPFTVSVTNDTTRRTVADGWPWPVAEGTAGDWTAHWSASQNITLEVQGAPAGWNASAFDGDVAIAYADQRTERVIVPAGEFTTDVIREQRPEGGHRLRWYSPLIGNDVRQEEFNGTGDRVASAVLLDYAYAAGAPTAPFPWLLALNAALGAAAIVFLIAVAVRRRRKSQDVWMPPAPSGETQSGKLSP